MIWLNTLTFFRSLFRFCTPWKHQKSRGLLIFSRGMTLVYLPEIGWKKKQKTYIKRFQKKTVEKAKYWTIFYFEVLILFSFFMFFLNIQTLRTVIFNFKLVNPSTSSIQKFPLNWFFLKNIHDSLSSECFHLYQILSSPSFGL